MLLIAILVFGLGIGWIAQLILGRGTRPNAQSLVAGLVGSLVGGLLSSLLFGDGIELRPSGILGSIVGAMLVLVVWSAVSARSGAST